MRDAQQEREAVVEWLKRAAARWDRVWQAETGLSSSVAAGKASVLFHIADAIDRGEHRK